MEIIEHSRANDKAGNQEENCGGEHASIGQVGEKERREKRNRKNEECAHLFTLYRQPGKHRPALLKEMQESDRPEKEKHVTKSTTSKPQEEFIEKKARPSRDKDTPPKPAPPKGLKER
jgi:hypothetical protein